MSKLLFQKESRHAFPIGHIDKLHQGLSFSKRPWFFEMIQDILDDWIFALSRSYVCSFFQQELCYFRSREGITFSARDHCVQRRGNTCIDQVFHLTLSIRFTFVQDLDDFFAIHGVRVKEQFSTCCDHHDRHHPHPSRRKY